MAVILGWWEVVRTNMKRPSDFARSVDRLPHGIKTMMIGLVNRAREAGHLDAPAELDDVRTALVALAVAMRPPGEKCTLTAELIEELLIGGSPVMAVPLFFGDKLCVRVSETQAMHGYNILNFSGLSVLRLTYLGASAWTLPPLPANLAWLELVSTGALVLDAPTTVAGKLECVACTVVAVGTPTEVLRLVRCRADVSRLVQSAAGIRVEIDGGAEDGLRLDGGWYPSMSLNGVAVSGHAQVGKLSLLKVRVGGQLTAGTARIHSVSGDGRVEAGLVVTYSHPRRPEGGARLVTPGAVDGAPAGTLCIVSDRFCGVPDDAEVLGEPIELQRALVRESGRVWGGRTAIGGGKEGMSAYWLSELFDGRGSLLRACHIGASCPPGDIETLVLTSDRDGCHHPFGDLGKAGAALRVELLVVRCDLLTCGRLAEAVSVRPGGVGLEVARLLAVGPDGAEDVEAGERMAALLNATRVGLEAAEAAGVPAGWLSDPLYL